MAKKEILRDDAVEICWVYVDEPGTLQSLAERDMPAKIDLFFIPTLKITLEKTIYPWVKIRTDF